MIALFFATAIESKLITKKISCKSNLLIRNTMFIKGTINNSEIVLCVSGVGKVNATISSLLAFNHFPISKAVISGIAGAYPSSGLNICDIAIAEKEIIADEGLLINCEDSNNSFIFMNTETIPLYIPDVMKNLKSGTFLTVSICTGNIQRAKFLEKNFNAICENMEGAAIAKVAQIYGIPCIELRSISNIITDRTKLLTSEQVSKTAEVVQKFILDNLNLI